MIGAVRGIDETGHPYDDTKRYIEATASERGERHQVYEGNARRVFPRLDAALKASNHVGGPYVRARYRLQNVSP
jgi:4-oxalmesaconate hydratase